MSAISPRTLKGGLVMIDPDTAVPLGAVILQYNPDSLTRKLQPQSVPEQPDRSEVLRLKGPAIETINLSAELDATDQLEFPSQNPLAVQFGILPQLAALEMLVYPSSVKLIANEALSLLGTIEAVPMESALTLFVWSPSRVIPVRVTDIDITEDAFDPNLNPIRAKVNLGMRVLSVSDVTFLSPAGALYMIYQIGKEAMALANTLNTVADLGAGAP
ncbi:hypothetical protein IQ288_31590 [Burkholderia sp. R-69980]|nr:hypothetical protein [Burkholderia sp. R-69980]